MSILIEIIIGYFLFIHVTSPPTRLFNSQSLFFHKEDLYETFGSYKNSKVLKYLNISRELQIDKQILLNEDLFITGATSLSDEKDNIYQLTLENRIVLF